MQRKVFTDTTLSHYKLIAGDISATPSPVDGESSVTPLPIFASLTVYNPFFRPMQKKDENKAAEPKAQPLSRQKRA